VKNPGEYRGVAYLGLPGSYSDGDFSYSGSSLSAVSLMRTHLFGPSVALQFVFFRILFTITPLSKDMIAPRFTSGLVETPSPI
jgi:hypothetical protein